MRLSRFTAARKPFCVDPLGVRGIVEHPQLAPVPGAPEWLVGAYNHLGRAVAVVDLGAMLSFTPPQRTPRALLLVESAGRLLALPADAPPSEFHARSFTRRGELLEIVDRADDVLWIDLSRLAEKIEDVLLGKVKV